MNNFLNYDSDHVGFSFFIGAAILIISHGIHIVDPNYHLFFQVSFIIGYTLFMITPLLKGKKMNIYKTIYKLSIIVIVIIGIVLDNIYFDKIKENKENKENKETDKN